MTLSLAVKTYDAQPGDGIYDVCDCKIINLFTHRNILAEQWAFNLVIIEPNQVQTMAEEKLSKK